MKIIYEDAHVLVCHKPAGLATQSGRVGQADLVSELKKYLNMWKDTVSKGNGGNRGGQVSYLGVVHRLDQPVEGLLVFAKSKEAAAHLSGQLTRGSLNKRYYAVVCGKLGEKSGELVDYLLKDGNMARVADAQMEGAKKAVLKYTSVREWKIGEEGADVRLLDVCITTGRFHQIRAQLSHAGLPLLSDNKYGTPKSVELGKQLGFRNVALFAYQLEFVHPTTGKQLSFCIEPEFPI